MVSHSRRGRCPYLPVLAFCGTVGLALVAQLAAAETDDARNDSVLASLLNGEVPADVAALKDMERRVQAVAQKVIPTTVAIRVEQAHGSGVIINSEGYILTAAHVAGAPDRPATIRLHDGQRISGITLGVFRTLDAGLVKITTERPTWPYAAMGTSDDLVRGQWCLATGHPNGYQRGRAPIVRLGRILEPKRDAITTDCLLIGGDSGGPLFDLSGRVIGIHSRIGEPLNQNLHVPISAYSRSWDRLVAGEAWGRLPGSEPERPFVEAPFIGVRGKEDNSDAEIVHVYPNSPAERAGLKLGDVIIRFARSDVSDFDSLKTLVSRRQPGDTVRVEVLRGNRTLPLNLTIGKRLVKRFPG